MERLKRTRSTERTLCADKNTGEGGGFHRLEGKKETFAQGLTRAVERYWEGEDWGKDRDVHSDAPLKRRRTANKGNGV